MTPRFSDSKDVAKHYEKYPYPSYPLYALGMWSELSRVDLKSWGVENSQPKLWIAGCGTIAPLMFGRRNPSAQILATDLSKRSLRMAKMRCRLFGIHNVDFLQHDLTQSDFRECFDAIDSYGVIHHTPNPKISLCKLAEALKPGGILRLMLYSKKTRRELEILRAEWKDNSSPLRKIKQSIPKEIFHKYSELKSRSGFADAVLHPLAFTFSEEEVEFLLEEVPALARIKANHSGNHILFLQKS